MILVYQDRLLWEGTTTKAQIHYFRPGGKKLRVMTNNNNVGGPLQKFFCMENFPQKATFSLLGFVCGNYGVLDKFHMDCFLRMNKFQKRLWLKIGYQNQTIVLKQFMISC